MRSLFRSLFSARRILLLVILGTLTTLAYGARPYIVIWMLIAECGVYLAYLNGMESFADFQALGGKFNGRRTVAIGNLRREIVRGLIALDFIAIGALLLYGISAVVVPGLILGSAGMALNSYLDRRDRLYLMSHGVTSRDERDMTQDETEDLKFGTERRALEAEHVKDNE